MKGYIVKGIGGFYYVKTEEGIVECKPRGIFRKQKIAPVAGDEVTVETEHGASVIAEIVRGGLNGVSKGQFEAAQAQGFNYLQRMGYIILPQSIPVMLPPMVNQVVNLFKNTSCHYNVGGAAHISVTYSFVTGASTGGAYAPAYIVCGVIFFVVCFPLSTLAARWEASLKERKGRVNPGLKTAAKKVELKEAA